MRHEKAKRLFFPFLKGIDTRNHPYARESPGLETCRNASFARPGAVSKRRAYTSLGVSILGGGSLSNIRRIVAHGDELLCFTDTALYSWSSALSKWVSKGSHLAIKTTERSRFIRPTEQIDCDRAELDGVIVYAWTDSSDGVLVAAVDKTTGAVILPPTSPGDASGSSTRPRLIALTNVVMLTWDASAGDLYSQKLDVADIATDLAANATITTGDCNSYYDVAKFSATQIVIAARSFTTTQYKAFIVGEDAVTDDSVTVARTCDGPIAVAVESNGSKIAIMRAVTSGSAIQGDILDSALDDTAHVSKAVGTFSTTCNQITAAFRSVQDSSQYRCYAFWSSNETNAASTAFVSQYNYLDDGGNLGTAATFITRLGIASRAFDHGGTIYVWGAFAAAGTTGLTRQLQNTYFLYDDAGTLHAKAAGAVGGGFSQSTGHLPQVEDLGSNAFAWAAQERRIIPLGNSQKGYSDRGLRDVAFEFDSDDARRTVKLGETIYVTGGQILQYDGEGLVELGYHIYPWAISAVPGTVTASTLADGTYTYIGSYSWPNAKGERDRSTTATLFDIAMTGGPREADIACAPCHNTLKQGTRAYPAMEYWRTLVDPVTGAPLYLVTSKDPTATGDNGYVEANPATGNLATLTDAFADDTLDDKQTWHENGTILENLSPPSASIVAADSDRVYLAGIASDPLQVRYSRLRGAGEVASFHDALSVQLPAVCGAITGMAHLNETLIVFGENSCYALDGRGLDNAGAGDNFRPRLIANDVGAVNQESIAVIPQGLFFKSSKGWYILPGAGQVPRYVGGAVADYDSETFVAIHILPEEHLILCVGDATADVTLSFDYAAAGGEGAWSVWDEEVNLVGATVFGGVHHIATSSAVSGQDADKTATGFATTVKTTHLRLDGLAGYALVKEVTVLGRYKGAFTMGVKLFRDYKATAYHEENWTVSPTTVDDPFQAKFSPTIQKMEAFAIEISDQGVNDDPAPVGDSFELIGVELLVEPIGGQFRVPAAQRAGAG